MGLGSGGSGGAWPHLVPGAPAPWGFWVVFPSTRFSWVVWFSRSAPYAAPGAPVRPCIRGTLSRADEFLSIWVTGLGGPVNPSQVLPGIRPCWPLVAVDPEFTSEPAGTWKNADRTVPWARAVTTTGPGIPRVQAAVAVTLKTTADLHGVGRKIWAGPGTPGPDPGRQRETSTEPPKAPRGLNFIFAGDPPLGGTIAKFSILRFY